MKKIQRILKGKAYYFYILAILLLFMVLLLKCNSHSSTSSYNLPRSTRMLKHFQKEKEIKCYLFILIMTSPKGKTRRQVIRKTWLRKKVYSNMTVVNRFIIGMKDLPENLRTEVIAEKVKFMDIQLLDNHKDSYQSLTLKLLKSFMWTHENVDAKFVMKVDDDSFVRLDKLLPSLHERQSLGHIYWGFFRGDSNVKRSGPWKETRWFLSDHYIPYALGGGYLISFDLLEFVSKNAEWLSIYNSEDVSLGVWLAPLKINRIHDVRFDTEYKTKGCSNKHIVSHKQQPEDMYSKQNELDHNNKLCNKESELLLTYDYNWNVSPIRCCKRVSINSFH